jgi:hypothetical protein
MVINIIFEPCHVSIVISTGVGSGGVLELDVSIKPVNVQSVGGSEAENKFGEVIIMGNIILGELPMSTVNILDVSNNLLFVIRITIVNVEPFSFKSVEW